MPLAGPAHKAYDLAAAKYKQYNSKHKPASAAKDAKEPSDPFAAPARGPQTPVDEFKLPIKASSKPAIEYAASPSRLHSMISARSLVGSPNKKTLFSPAKARDTPRTKARKWLGGVDQATALDWKQPMQSTSREAIDAMDEDDDASPVKPTNGKAFRPLFDSEPAPKLSFGKDAFKPQLPAEPRASRTNMITDLMAPRPGDAAAFEAEKKRVLDEGDAEIDQPKAKRAKKAATKRKGKGKKKADEPESMDEDDDEELLEVDGQQMQRRAYQPYANARRPPKEQQGSEDDFSDLDEPYEPALPADAAPSAVPMESPTAHVPSHLVSLLSLEASPIKKHRLQVQSRKTELANRVLLEPSIVRGSKPKGGLDELEDDLEEGSDALDEEEGDDDWESEPEGWKTLGGEDLIGLDEVFKDAEV
jgi:hypothetical protein